MTGLAAHSIHLVANSRMTVRSLVVIMSYVLWVRDDRRMSRGFRSSLIRRGTSAQGMTEYWNVGMMEEDESGRDGLLGVTPSFQSSIIPQFQFKHGSHLSAAGY
jgi:hypothetical protein